MPHVKYVKPAHPESKERKFKGSRHLAYGPVNAPTGDSALPVDSVPAQTVGYGNSAYGSLPYGESIDQDQKAIFEKIMTEYSSLFSVGE